MSKKKSAAVLGWGFGDDEVGNDLSLWGQQRAVPRLVEFEVLDVRRDEAVEKVSRAVADDLDHAPVGEKGSFHALGFPGIARNVRHPPVPLKGGRLAIPEMRLKEGDEARLGALDCYCRACCTENSPLRMRAASFSA